jgi:hypothetical protein
MDVLKTLQVAALLVTLGMGLYSFFKPKAITGFIGLEAPGPRGISELRGIFGGLLIGVGLAPLILDTQETYQAVGICYLAIAITRTISIFIDDSRAQSNLISVVTEWVFGVLLLL